MNARNEIINPYRNIRGNTFLRNLLTSSSFSIENTEGTITAIKKIIKPTISE
tara:strand:- start:668 stop:823 length:156 start_codon:yes stop_codon:yes gene_type:complete